MTLLEGVIVAGAALAVLRAARLAILQRSIPRLVDVTGPAPPTRSSVAVACAARDEAPHLERAVRSWLTQPVAQVIVVDDRSRDATGEVLARLASEDPRVVPLRVERRPDGWLGKCHALGLAAARARADFLLFTDADVRLAPGCVARAVAFAEREDADVVVLMPEVDCDNALQRAMTTAFFQFFLAALGGARANRDDGRCVVGIGAFNMVRRDAYERAGGHDPVRLQVGDDVALVRLLQHHGARTRLLSGEGLLRLRWQDGVIGTIRGLEKNFFWGARLSVPLVAAFTLAALVLLAPLAAVLAPTAVSLAALGAWVAGVLTPAAFAPREGRWASALLFPAAVVLMLVAAWNSTVRTLARGGISWRGDLIRIGELRAALLPWRWWRRPIAARARRPEALE